MGFDMEQQLTNTTKSVVLVLIISLGIVLAWASWSFTGDTDEAAGIQGAFQSQGILKTQDAVKTQDTLKIQDSILRQIEAFANNDGEEAWAYASEGIKRRFGSAQVFVEMVREAYPAVHNATQIEFTENVPHGIFHIQVVKLKGPEGKSWDAYYRMVQTEDEWKVAGVRLQPADIGI
jgi:regulatory protein YycH of two-component signal transduction system YycFG